MAEPATVECPTSLWRVGRVAGPAHFSTISPVDAAVESAGNRFDVPGGGVLYAATDQQGAYAETLARMRPSPRMRRLSFAGDESFMNVGSVPAEWRINRRMAEVRLQDPLPFLDVDAPETHMFLSEALEPLLQARSIDLLDVSHVRGSDRILTRAISEHAYVLTDDDGTLRYSGLRYMSRVGDFECWAVFDGTDVDLGRVQVIDKHDAALNEIARTFDLTIH